MGIREDQVAEADSLLMEGRVLIMKAALLADEAHVPSLHMILMEAVSDIDRATTEAKVCFNKGTPIRREENG